METEKLQIYINELIQDRPELLAEMEQYAQEFEVPIMELTGIETMLQLLRIQQPKSILEVGTAIGYSALRMAYTLPNTKIVTIERDTERLEKAKDYIKRAEKQSQIVLISGDALEVEAEIKAYAPYDTIFIDAAKAQYQRFFDMYSKYLSDTGIIITDNVLFKGMVAEGNIENRNIRALVRKINNFNSWLMGHPDYDSVIIPVGDGLAISKKR